MLDNYGKMLEKQTIKHLWQQLCFVKDLARKLKYFQNKNLQFPDINRQCQQNFNFHLKTETQLNIAFDNKILSQWGFNWIVLLGCEFAEFRKFRLVLHNM